MKITKQCFKNYLTKTVSKNGVFKHNIIPLDQLEDTSISYLEIIFQVRDTLKKH